MDDFRMHGWYCFVSDNRCLVMNDLITENMKLRYFLMLYSLLIKHDYKVFFKTLLSLQCGICQVSLELGSSSNCCDE